MDKQTERRKLFTPRHTLYAGVINIYKRKTSHKKFEINIKLVCKYVTLTLGQQHQQMMSAILAVTLSTHQHPKV